MAIAGASTNIDSPGQDYLRSLQVLGYRGGIFPINQRAPEVNGFRAFASVDEIPAGEPVDVVISCVPASAVLELVDACGRRGVPFLHLFTGRFSETGDASAADLERELEERARAAGVRLLGPNGLGVYYPAEGLAFRPDLPRDAGTVAFLSQSGNNAVEVAIRGHARGLRYGKVVNYGNGVGITPAELLRYLGDDPDTSVIGAYVEGVPDGRAFFEALRAAAARKPVIIHKAGRTAAGANSAASHTAALAGSADVWSAALCQADAIEARSQEQLLDLMVAASLMGTPGGRSIAVVGGGGGRSVQSADACEENGLRVAPLPPAVRDAVRAKAPGLADWVRNPVDQSILAGSGVSSNGLLEMMLASGAYDCAIANVGEDWFLGRPEAEDRLNHACARLAAIVAEAPVPVAVVLGATETADGEYRRIVDGVRDMLVAKGAAIFPAVERAAWAIGRLAPPS